VVGAAASLAVFFTVDRFDAVKLLAPLSFAVLVLGVSFDRGPVATVLRRPALQTLGRLSYSVYMTHVLLLMLLAPLADALAEPYRSAAKLGYVVLVLLVSERTYRWIEAPWRTRFSAYASGFAGRAGARASPGYKVGP
jgi:peptidoglycan/LPS O-acetylase OafA/YrhL